MQIRIKQIGSSEVKSIAQGDWIDLSTRVETILKKGEFAVIPLGVAMEIPKGYEAHIVPRSSTYKNFKIMQTNGVGIIDNSYCGDGDEWGFPALAMEDTISPAGTRICQFRIFNNQEPITLNLVDSLGNENRGGFGSTGL